MRKLGSEVDTKSANSDFPSERSSARREDEEIKIPAHVLDILNHSVKPRVNIIKLRVKLIDLVDEPIGSDDLLHVGKS